MANKSRSRDCVAKRISFRIVLPQERNAICRIGELIPAAGISTFAAADPFCCQERPAFPRMPGLVCFGVRKRLMIMSKLSAKFGAVAFMAAMGVAYPALAAHYGPAYTAPYQTGGGSAGYNSHIANDYHLRPHHPMAHSYYNYEAPRIADPTTNLPGANCPPQCWRLQHHR
jgi:hypothetical protein